MTVLGSKTAGDLAKQSKPTYEQLEAHNAKLRNNELMQANMISSQRKTIENLRTKLEAAKNGGR